MLAHLTLTVQNLIHTTKTYISTPFPPCNIVRNVLDLQGITQDWVRGRGAMITCDSEIWILLFSLSVPRIIVQDCI